MLWEIKEDLVLDVSPKRSRKFKKQKTRNGKGALRSRSTEAELHLKKPENRVFNIIYLQCKDGYTKEQSIKPVTQLYFLKIPSLKKFTSFIIPISVVWKETYSFLEFMLSFSS